MTKASATSKGSDQRLSGRDLRRHSCVMRVISYVCKRSVKKTTGIAQRGQKFDSWNTVARRAKHTHTKGSQYSDFARASRTLQPRRSRPAPQKCRGPDIAFGGRNHGWKHDGIAPAVHPQFRADANPAAHRLYMYDTFRRSYAKTTPLLPLPCTSRRLSRTPFSRCLSARQASLLFLVPLPRIATALRLTANLLARTVAKPRLLLASVSTTARWSASTDTYVSCLPVRRRVLNDLLQSGKLLDSEGDGDGSDCPSSAASESRYSCPAQGSTAGIIISGLAPFACDYSVGGNATGLTCRYTAARCPFPLDVHELTPLLFTVGHSQLR